MKLSTLFMNNLSIFKRALENAIIPKVATDSAQAGGVMVEMNAEQFSNEVLHQQELGFVCLTNKTIERSINRGFEFDFSLVGASDFKEFKKVVKTSDTIVSSADVYLFKIDGSLLTLVDAESFKTSTSDGVNQIYLHNDADGSVYNGAITGNHPDFGQVLLLTFSPKQQKCHVYLAEGKMSKFTDLFEDSEEDGGQLVFHGSNLKDKSDMTKASGLGRQLIVLINREKKKKKKDGEDAASTSFTRGIKIDKGFLPILCKRGLIQELFSFNIDFAQMEEEDFMKRCPQLAAILEENVNDNAA